MTETTTIGRFTRRQLDQLRRTAVQGARVQASRLERMASRIHAELGHDDTPNVDVLEAAAKLQHWLDQLTTLDHIESVISADKDKL